MSTTKNNIFNKNYKLENCISNLFSLKGLILEYNDEDTIILTLLDKNTNKRVFTISFIIYKNIITLSTIKKYIDSKFTIPVTALCIC
jgi:hypothetical protein